MDKKGIESVALSIRSLSMDAIQKANSGHPGLPMWIKTPLFILILPFMRILPFL